MLMDPDGREIIGKDGKPINYTIKNGKIIWSKNVKSKKDIKNHKLYQYVGVSQNSIYKHFEKTHNWFEKLFERL